MSSSANNDNVKAQVPVRLFRSTACQARAQLIGCSSRGALDDLDLFFGEPVQLIDEAVDSGLGGSDLACQGRLLRRCIRRRLLLMQL